MKELYELYANKSAFGGLAFVCGYSIDGYLIGAIQPDYNKGWTSIDKSDIIVTSIDNEEGYCYVDVKDIDI